LFNKHALAKENDALSQQQQQQLENGERQSIFNVEVTPEHDSPHHLDHRRRVCM